jgi:hypothetical protein
MDTDRTQRVVTARRAVGARTTLRSSQPLANADRWLSLERYTASAASHVAQLFIHPFGVPDDRATARRERLFLPLADLDVEADHAVLVARADNRNVFADVVLALDDLL